MRRLAVAAAIIAGLDDVFYLGTVGGQLGPPVGDFLRVPFVAIFTALMAISAGLAARPSAGNVRPLLLGISAAGLVAIGFFGISSLGLPLLFAGLLAAIALASAIAQIGPPRSALQAFAGIVGALVVLVGGFEVVDRVVACPPNVSESVSGLGPLGDSYSWSCDNGKLTIR